MCFVYPQHKGPRPKVTHWLSFSSYCLTIISKKTHKKPCFSSSKNQLFLIWNKKKCQPGSTTRGCMQFKSPFFANSSLMILEFSLLQGMHPTLPIVFLMAAQLAVAMGVPTMFAVSELSSPQQFFIAYREDGWVFSPLCENQQEPKVVKNFTPCIFPEPHTGIRKN